MDAYDAPNRFRQMTALKRLQRQIIHQWIISLHTHTHTQKSTENYMWK